MVVYAHTNIYCNCWNRYFVGMERERIRYRNGRDVAAAPQTDQ